MRKEMNSKSKRKWVAGGLAAFASIALLTTGFATWIVGTQNMSADINGTTVNVDTATNQSIELSMPITSPTLYFAETKKPDVGGFVQLDGDPKGDLTLDFDHIMVTYGSDSGFTPANYKLHFSIVSIMNREASVENKMTLTDEVFGRTAGDYTYFEVPDDIPLTDGESGKGSITSVSGTAKRYTFKESSVLFKWGTAFVGKSPATFYNLYFDANGDEKTAANAEIVKNELKGMEEKLNGATINLKAELVTA